MARKMVKKLVSIVITTRNRKKFVLDCLSSVFDNDYPNIEVILSDNASHDGTVDAVRKQFPKVKIAAGTENLGLNGGKNRGQKIASGDYIFFLDSDTIIAKNIISEMVNIAQKDSQIGLVCPKIYYYDKKDTIFYAGTFLNLLTSQTKNIGANEKDIGQWDQIRETQFAPTAYLATRKVADLLKEHDEIFFMTYGDTDYGFRVRKTGYKVMFAPSARLWHRLNFQDNTQGIRGLGYNIPLRAFYITRNRVIFMKRHAPKLNFIIFMILFYPLFTLYYSYKILQYGGGWKFLKPHLDGTLAGLKYIFGRPIDNITYR